MWMGNIVMNLFKYNSKIHNRIDSSFISFIVSSKKWCMIQLNLNRIYFIASLLAYFIFIHIRIYIFKYFIYTYNIFFMFYRILSYDVYYLFISHIYSFTLFIYFLSIFTYVIVIVYNNI